MLRALSLVPNKKERKKKTPKIIPYALFFRAEMGRQKLCICSNLIAQLTRPAHTHTLYRWQLPEVFHSCYVILATEILPFVWSEVKSEWKKKRIKYRMTHTGGWNMRLAWISINHITHVTFCEIRHRRLMHRKDYWLDVISNTSCHRIDRTHTVPDRIWTKSFDLCPESLFVTWWAARATRGTAISICKLWLLAHSTNNTEQKTKKQFKNSVYNVMLLLNYDFYLKMCRQTSACHLHDSICPSRLQFQFNFLLPDKSGDRTFNSMWCDSFADT